MKLLLLGAGCLLARAAGAQVGIGTTSLSANSAGAVLTEEIALKANVIGYKGWASGKSIAWNLGTRMLVPC